MVFCATAAMGAAVQAGFPRGSSGRHFLAQLVTHATTSFRRNWGAFALSAQLAGKGWFAALGVSFRHSVSLRFPSCPPSFLSEIGRRLQTRADFFSPSLDGSLVLLLLFGPRRRSNLAM